MALVAITFFVACTSENSETVENESNTKLMTFTATQDRGEAGTKAALASDCKTINWEQDDKISVLYGTANQEFTLTGGAGTSSATFQGSAATADSYTAVYPYCSSAKLESEGTVSGITLPATQTATRNGFDKSAALMIAKSNNTSLSFLNAVGYVKVMPKFDCSQIILSAADETAVLAGTGKLSLNSEDSPTLDFTSSTNKSYSIKLTGTISSDNAYYIAVPAITLNAGWSISFTTTSDSKIYTRKGSNPITFTRNKVINLGEFDLTATYWELEKNGKVPAEKQIDMGLIITENGTDYKVIFAQSNLTATGLAVNDYDYGDYFAWGATEPWYKSLSPSTVWKDNKTGGYTQDNCPSYQNGYYDDLGILLINYDAAQQILGGDWQMPTKEIWEALNSSDYSWEFITPNSINGYLVKSISTSQTVFLPAAGYFDNETIVYSNQIGYYWSSTSNYYENAFNLKLDNSTHAFTTEWRYFGHSIRPVRLIKIE